MTTAVREQLSSQADAAVRAALRQIAEAEERQFQAVPDEALRDSIDRHQSASPRKYPARSTLLDSFHVKESRSDTDSPLPLGAEG